MALLLAGHPPLVPATPAHRLVEQRVHRGRNAGAFRRSWRHSGISQRGHVRGVCRCPRRAEESSETPQSLLIRVRGPGGQRRAVEGLAESRDVGRRGVFRTGGRRSRLGDPTQAQEAQHLRHSA